MNFHRKWALAIPAVLFGGYAILALFGQGAGEGAEQATTGLVALAVLALALLVLGAGALVALITRSSSSAPAVRLADRFLPATVMAISLVILSAIVRHDVREAQLAFAAEHRAELAGAPPQSVVYAEGIPDGGTAIVRLPGRNPESLSQAVMVDLTGERIKRCEQLDEEFWACRFD